MRIITTIRDEFPLDAPATGNVRHYYNAHFPGLYSVVLANHRDLLVRAYIAKPDELCHDLQDEDRPFLWHAHGYDFCEVTVLGSVANICVRERREGETAPFRTFQKYHITAGIDTERKPSLYHLGAAALVDSLSHVATRNTQFFMDASVIHRVVFLPCNITGWFCCIVQELRKTLPPTEVYSPYVLCGVPYADELYKQISHDEAAELLVELNDAIDTVEGVK